MDSPDDWRFAVDEAVLGTDADYGEPDEIVDDDEPAADDTIVAEPATVEDVTEPTGPARGRRRAGVFGGLVALMLVATAAAGALVVSLPADSPPRKKTGSEHASPSTTTTSPAPTTGPSPAASAPLPPPTAPRTSATSGPTVSGDPSVGLPPTAPEPPTSPPPETTSPPPSAPPTSSPPTTIPGP